MNQEVKRHALNVAGRYYVDQDCCTFSGNCLLVAFGHFRMDTEQRVYVIRQPRTPEEETRCRQALKECPVAAIHDDGEI